METGVITQQSMKRSLESEEHVEWLGKLSEDDIEPARNRGIPQEPFLRIPLWLPSVSISLTASELAHRQCRAPVLYPSCQPELFSPGI